jgi:Domain of unknown function (DUF4399)
VRTFQQQLALALLATVAVSATMAAEQSVFLVEPQDGAVVPSEFKVVFGTKGWQVRPLGDMTAGTGHHHLVVNAASVDKGALIPVNEPEKYIHFGKGQTETVLKLAPGRYTLQLQLGDGGHNSLGADARATITVSVK